jgi:3-deoxy-7-phosphoheptulonate synthase
MIELGRFSKREFFYMLSELSSDITSLEEAIILKCLMRVGYQVKLQDKFQFALKANNTFGLYNLVSRQYKNTDTVIKLRDTQIGGNSLFIIAGPCLIESEDQLAACAQVAISTGANALHGGVYKPNTLSYEHEFQGMGLEGIKLISKIAKQHGLLSVIEVMDLAQAGEASPYVDILQIGSSNVQNYSLLKALGKFPNPILLKRGLATTYREFLMAAEYIMVNGNHNIILFECGIRTFETYTQNTLDLNAVPALQEQTHLPIIVDPSHGTGIRFLVPVMAKAAIAAGASGILVEMHPNPDQSTLGAIRAISFDAFTKMMLEISAIHAVTLQF